MVFQDRTEAGKELAGKLSDYHKTENLLVLAIPRGGVAVGRELAVVLKCPLDVIITKKIGAPGDSELAIGAMGAIGEPVIDEELAEKVGADKEYIKDQILTIREEIMRREKEFRGDKLSLDLKDKTVILTDDGVATGATMLAAVEIIRQQNPKRLIVAVPVIARDTLTKIETQSDEVVYLEAPQLFFAVGQFYQAFSQVSDGEVKELLK